MPPADRSTGAESFRKEGAPLGRSRTCRTSITEWVSQGEVEAHGSWAESQGARKIRVQRDPKATLPGRCSRKAGLGADGGTALRVGYCVVQMLSGVVTGLMV
jgi:hypothetical protein